MDPAVILSIFSLVTTVAGFVYTWFKDARDRKWRKEDEALKSQHLDLQDKAIAEGTDNAVKAYTEANATNMKIAALQQQINDTATKAK